MFLLILSLDRPYPRLSDYFEKQIDYTLFSEGLID